MFFSPAHCPVQIITTQKQCQENPLLLDYFGQTAYMGKAKGPFLHLFVVSLQWQFKSFQLSQVWTEKTHTEHLNDHKNTENADVA